MTPEALFRLIVWISMAFWAVWYTHVQLERLNPNVFEQLKGTVLKRLEKSVGALRAIGFVLYSPYVMPVRSAIAWLIIAIVMSIL